LSFCNILRRYSEYFKNKELMLEIDKDTKRTWSSMHFFAVPNQSSDASGQAVMGPSRQQVHRKSPKF
jgi:hypothetical protein